MGRRRLHCQKIDSKKFSNELLLPHSPTSSRLLALAHTLTDPRSLNFGTILRTIEIIFVNVRNTHALEQRPSKFLARRDLCERQSRIATM